MRSSPCGIQPFDSLGIPLYKTFHHLCLAEHYFYAVLLTVCRCESSGGRVKRPDINSTPFVSLPLRELIHQIFLSPAVPLVHWFLFSEVQLNFEFAKRKQRASWQVDLRKQVSVALRSYEQVKGRPRLSNWLWNLRWKSNRNALVGPQLASGSKGKVEWEREKAKVAPGIIPSALLLLLPLPSATSQRKDGSHLMRNAGAAAAAGLSPTLAVFPWVRCWWKQPPLSALVRFLFWKQWGWI